MRRRCAELREVAGDFPKVRVRGSPRGHRREKEVRESLQGRRAMRSCAELREFAVDFAWSIAGASRGVEEGNGMDSNGTAPGI